MTKKTGAILTIKQANAIAAGQAKVSVDPVDSRLWRIEGEGWILALEPMGREDLKKHLATQAAAGTGMTDALRVALQDNLSPQAVAAIAAHLFAASTKDRGVNKEIRWLADQLVGLVGTNEYNRLIEEVGL